MFFVYSDNIVSGKLTISVIVIVAIQVAAFIFSMSGGALQFSENYPLAFVPLLFSIKPFIYAYTLISSTFLHIGFLHLLGNVMFFVTFGRTLETLFGATVFTSAYIGLGALAFIGSWAISPDSVTPIIGSSGAVAFLMGAYLVLFPKARLNGMATLPPFYKKFTIRAYVFVVLWAVVQIYSIGEEIDGTAGVAYATHALGFFIGIVAAACWKEFASDTEERIHKLLLQEHNNE